MRGRYHVFVAHSHSDERWYYQGGDFMGEREDIAASAIAAALEAGSGDGGPYMFIDEAERPIALLVPQHPADGVAAYQVHHDGSAREFPPYNLAACPPSEDPAAWQRLSPTAEESAGPAVPWTELDATVKRLKAGLEAISASGGAAPDEYLTARMVEVREATLMALEHLDDALLNLDAGSAPAAKKGIEKAMSILNAAVPPELHA